MTITNEDLMLVLQQSSAPQTCRLKIEVLDRNQQYVGEIEGIVSGSVSISAESDIRRTASVTLQPTYTQHIKLEEGGLLWLDKDIRLSVGLYDVRKESYHYYPLGYYVYTDTSATYDAATNQLTVNCADFMKKLDGTKNGQLGALVISYPGYEEDSATGEVLQHYIIRNAVTETLENLADIQNYLVDDIGTFYAMPEYNEDWQSYREKNADIWNAIPYDQEFSCGCSVLSILTTFRDLYPNYEMFFDPENNTFICRMIPSCYDDNIVLDNAFFQRVLISENTSVDLTAVKNIYEVWGKVIDIDYYSEEVSYADNTYSATIEKYEEEYKNGDLIALKVNNENESGANVNINGFGPVPILNEGDDSPIEAGKLKADNVYSFKIKKKYDSGLKETVINAYLLGQWQVHALNVLTDGSISEELRVGSDGVSYHLYSPEYFKHFYNCERVEFEVIPDSPYTVQKLGEVLDVKSGDEFENITSDDLAAERARWENWKNSRLTDNITITTALLPFLDVNKKISYQPSDSDIEMQYIIKSVSHDFTGYTSTVTMMKFYPLYIEPHGTYEILNEYTHEQLNKYTQEQLQKLKGRMRV